MPKPEDAKSTGVNAALGFEASDVNVSGVLVFLASLASFILVFFVFCFAMGKVINSKLVEHDGPPNKWHQLGATPHKRGQSMASTTAMEQQQLATMTQRFPTPRLQMDDGNQDLADMHQKEDLLLDHYTWVDKSQGKVRIPIDRAMELIVERGLPVAPATPPATGDSAAIAIDEAHSITPPLTNGFARTTYEQEQMTEENLQPKQRSDVQSSNSRKPSVPGTPAQAGGVQ